MKRCLQCSEEKRDSQFRYIKYFDARRSICKQCEARQRQQSRRELAQHVRETGFTPGILDRLRAQATRRATRQAREAVLSGLSLHQLRTFRAAEFVERFLSVVLLLCFAAAYLVSLLVIVGKPVQWLAAPLCLASGVGLARLLVRRLWTRHITHEIRQRSTELYAEVFEQGRHKHELRTNASMPPRSGVPCGRTSFAPNVGQTGVMCVTIAVPLCLETT